MDKTGNTMEILKSKICDISLDYADCVKNRIEHYLKEDEFDSTALEEINQGIRMLNHVTATIERIVRLQDENTSRQSDASVKVCLNQSEFESFLEKWSKSKEVSFFE